MRMGGCGCVPATSATLLQYFLLLIGENGEIPTLAAILQIYALEVLGKKGKS